MQSPFYPKTTNPIQTSRLLFQIPKHRILTSQTSKQNAITRMQTSQQLVEPAERKQQVSKTNKQQHFIRKLGEMETNVMMQLQTKKQASIPTNADD